MKKKITKNIGLKSLSIFIAIMLWIVIVNIDNPIITKRFRDVLVKIVNDDIVLDLEQVYDVVQGETIDFTIEGRKNIVDKLLAKDFNVTADFNSISAYDTIPINISPKEHGENIRIVEGKYPIMKISREESMEKSFKIDIIEKGAVAKGYYIGEKVASPNLLTVSGPRARVENVASVVVEVDVYGAANSFSVKTSPKALDANGQHINDLKLKLNEEEVNVKIDLFKTKEISLIINPTGAPSEGYKMTNIEYEPRKITIAGEGDEYNQLSYIAINESIAGASSTIEKEIDLQDYLPTGIYLVSEPTAVIKVKIEKLKLKTISINQNDIRIKNKAKYNLVKFIDLSSVSLVVMGTKEVIDNIQVTDIKPYIDMKEIEYKEGKVNYELPIWINPTVDISIINQPLVNISIN